MSEQDMQIEDEKTAAGGSVAPAPEESSSASPEPEAVSEEAQAADSGVENQGETPAEPSATVAEETPEEAPVAVETPAETPPPVAAAPSAPRFEIDAPGMNWYIIHTYSGFENKVAESLKARAQAFGFMDRVGHVMVPTEEVIELRNSKKVTSKRLLYPGYVMVQLALQEVDWEDLWHLVVETPRVTGFVGGGKHPIPMSREEVDAVFNRQAASAERPRPKLTFEKNETVRIIDGPFTNFQGKVDDVNLERNTLRVLVTIFGRATPVELEFLQVEKLS